MEKNTALTSRLPWQATQAFFSCAWNASAAISAASAASATMSPVMCSTRSKTRARRGRGSEASPPWHPHGQNGGLQGAGMANYTCGAEQIAIPGCATNFFVTYRTRIGYNASTSIWTLFSSLASANAVT